jgi:hypothetical protein
MDGPLGELTLFLPRRALRSILGFFWSFIAKVQFVRSHAATDERRECGDVTEPEEFRQDSNHEFAWECTESDPWASQNSCALRRARSQRPILMNFIACWRPAQRTVLAHSHRLSREFGSLSSTGNDSACVAGSVYVTASSPLGETSSVRHR